MDTSSAELRQAISLAKSGNRIAAQELLVGIVRREPHNEMAWLWLADTLPDDVQRISVLREALRRNSQSILIQEALQSLLEDLAEGDGEQAGIEVTEEVDIAGTLDVEANLDEPDLQQKILATETDQGESRGKIILRDVFWVLFLIVFLGILLFTWLGKGFHLPLSGKPSATAVITSTPIPSATVVTATILPSPLPTETSMPLPELPVGIGTQVPQAIAAPGLDNIAGLEQIALWGTGNLLGADWSPDGSEIAVIYSRGIEFYDAVSGQKKENWQLQPVPLKVKYSKDGSYLAAFSSQPGGYFMRRDGQDKQFPLAEYTGILNDIAFSPDGSLLAGAGADGKIILWDAATGAMVNTFEGSAGEITSVVFSSGGRLLASGEKSGRILIWDIQENTRIAVLNGHEGPVNSLAFSPSGLVLASASSDGTARLWDIYAETELHRLKGHELSVNGVEFSPDGAIVLSVGGDGVLRFWSAGIGVQLGNQALNDGNILQVGYAPDGGSIFCTTEEGSVLILHKSEEDQPYQVTTLAKYQSQVKSTAVDSSGHYLAAGYADGTIRITSLLTGQEEKSLIVFDDAVDAVAYSPDGKMLATGDESGLIRVLDSGSGTELLSLRGHQAGVYSLVFSNTNQMLLSGSMDGTIRLWNLSNAQEIIAIDDHHVVAKKLLFSKDESQVIAGLGDGTVRIWDIEVGAPLAVLQGHTDEVLDIQLSTDGLWLASASVDGTVRLWDAEQDKLVRVLQGSSHGSVRSIQFTPDKSMLLVIYEDGTIQAWNTGSGTVTETFVSTGESPIAFYLVQNDQYLVEVQQDGFTQVWGIVRSISAGETISSQGSSETVDSQSNSAVEEVLPAQLFFIAARDGIDQVWRMETDGKTVSQITDEVDPVTAMDVSQANGMLAYVSGNNLILSDLDGGNRRILVEGGEVSPASKESRWKKQLSSPLWSPSGSRLAYALNGVQIYDFTYDRSYPYLVNKLPDSGTSNDYRLYRPVLWSPYESRLFAEVELYEGTSLVIIPTDGEAVMAPEGISVCCHLSWNINGYEVWLGSDGVSGSSGGLWRIDAVDGKVETVIEPQKEDEIQTFTAFPIQVENGKLFSFFAQGVDGENLPFSLVVVDEDGQSGRTLLRSDSYSQIQEVLWAEDASLAVLQASTGAMTLLYPEDIPARSLPAEGFNLRWGIQVSAGEGEETPTQVGVQPTTVSDSEIFQELYGRELPSLPEGVHIIGKPKVVTQDNYGLTVARYGDLMMIWLESYLYTDQLGNVHARIEDVLAIPYSAGSYFWYYEGCRRNDEPAPDVMVMGPSETVDKPIIFAWNIDERTLKINPTLTTGLHCEP